MAWCNRFKQHKTFLKKLSKELMLLAWHPENGGIGMNQKTKRKK